MRGSPWTDKGPSIVLAQAIAKASPPTDYGFPRARETKKTKRATMRAALKCIRRSLHVAGLGGAALNRPKARPYRHPGRWVASWRPSAAAPRLPSFPYRSLVTHTHNIEHGAKRAMSSNSRDRSDRNAGREGCGSARLLPGKLCREATLRYGRQCL